MERETYRLKVTQPRCLLTYKWRNPWYTPSPSGMLAKGNAYTGHNTDEPQKHQAKWKAPDTRACTQKDPIYRTF